MLCHVRQEGCSCRPRVRKFTCDAFVTVATRSQYAPRPDRLRLLSSVKRPNRKPKHLPQQEQIDLAVRAQNGDEHARHLLVESNLGFIGTQARRFVRKTPLLELNDYVAVGVIGLLQALKKFDAERGSSFLTYARYWVRLRMKELLVQTVIRVSGPIEILSKAWTHRYQRDREDLAKKHLSAQAEDDAVAKSHGMSHSTLLAAESIHASPSSMDKPLDFSPDLTLHDVLASADISVEEVLGDEKKLAYCRSLIANYGSTLPFTRRVILRERLLEGRTLRDVGDLVGFTRERVRQIEKELYADLRKIFAALVEETQIRHGSKS